MRELNDEEFIHVARYARTEFISKQDKTYMEQRLDSLGYTIEYGCCGTNILRMKRNERQSHISTNE